VLALPKSAKAGTDKRERHEQCQKPDESGNPGSHATTYQTAFPKANLFSFRGRRGCIIRRLRTCSAIFEKPPPEANVIIFRLRTAQQLPKCVDRSFGQDFDQPRLIETQTGHLVGQDREPGRRFTPGVNQIEEKNRVARCDQQTPVGELRACDEILKLQRQPKGLSGMHVPRLDIAAIRTRNDAAMLRVKCDHGHPIFVGHLVKQRLACLSVPDSCGAGLAKLAARRNNQAPVRRKNGRSHFVVMHHWSANGLGGVRIPQPRGLVFGGSENSRAIRTEPREHYIIFVLQRLREFASVGRIPDARLAVCRGGDNAAAIGTERAEIDLGFVLERRPGGPGILGLPQPCGAVERCWENPVTIWAEGGVANRASV
jgi:hypothetical protein